jgi:hypothetical protein
MVTVACHDASGASCTPHTAMAAMLLGLLLAIAGRRPVSAAEGNAAGLAASKAQDLFPTRNDTLFVEDLESSRIARTFAENVALPIKSMVPRSYSAQFVRAQMSVRVTLFTVLALRSFFFRSVAPEFKTDLRHSEAF